MATFMNKSNLKSGETFIFGATEARLSRTDDIREAEVSFSDRDNYFKIEFNGAWFIYKTYKAFLKKLGDLCKNWELEEKLTDDQFLKFQIGSND